MRRRELKLLPALMHWFNLKPWEVERLTRPELEAMLDWIVEATS